MGSNTRFGGIVAALLSGVFSASLHAQVNVTTYHNDNARTGQNTLETTLTPLNVNSTQFGKLFTVAVDGYVYAQPLYLSNVQIQGGTHNVVYVATEHDSVYAIDADSGAVYWHVNLIPPGSATVSSTKDFKCGDLIPEVGITGTPVIDINTGTLYVVAASIANGNVVQYLHALDVRTLAEKFGGPINIKASAPGAAIDGNGATVSFNPRYENQRAALLLDNGYVVIAWASHCDVDPWHGWVVAYGAGTLALEDVFNASPNGYANGVWMSGGGLAADANGSIYFATGNGSWNGTTDFGDSIVKLGVPSGGSFPVLDYFTPYNQSTLSLEDADVSAGGLVLLPPIASGKQFLTQMGKEGKMYLIDRNDMGKNCAVKVPACRGGDPQIVQEISKATVGVWGSPAYWNGSVYWGGASDVTGAPDTLKAFSFNAGGSGLLSTRPTSQSAKSFNFSAPIPTISANGSASGILWAVENSSAEGTCKSGANCQVLYAYDATNLATLLYTSNQAANHRDVPGSAVKFATPIIANGKVYVAGQSYLAVYGILGSVVPAAPAPTFSPASGSFTTTQTVALADSLSTAVIHYTTDNTTPTAASAVYAGQLRINQTTTVQAIATASGYANSGVVAASYVIGTSSTHSISVDLNAAYNVNAIFSNGSAVTNGGVDTNSQAYSANLLGSSVVWSGATFTIGGAGIPNAVDSAVLTLPAGNYSSLKLLGTAVQGSHVRQVFVVTYTDGTTDTFTQSMSDWTAPQKYAGEATALTMPYRVGLQGTLSNHPVYVYGYSFAINAAKTVKSLTLPRNREIVVLSVSLTGSSGTPPPPPGTSVSVDLSSAFSVNAIFSNGTVVTNGGMDTYGNAYSENLLGSSVVWSGTTFNLGSAGVPSAVEGTVLSLPAGKFSALKLLGAAVQGSHVRQVFVVTYTDGTTDTFTQSMSDWTAPQKYAGEATAVTEAYRVRTPGTLLNHPTYMYGYSFAVNPAKTVKNLTPPSNRDIVLLSITLVP